MQTLFSLRISSAASHKHYLHIRTCCRQILNIKCVFDGLSNDSPDSSEAWPLYWMYPPNLQIYDKVYTNLPYRKISLHLCTVTLFYFWKQGITNKSCSIMEICRTHPRFFSDLPQLPRPFWKVHVITRPNSSALI